jgi:hypothetical protein
VREREREREREGVGWRGWEGDDVVTSIKVAVEGR